MAPKNFTQRDMDLMAAAFQSLKTPPEIDYNKLAEKAGYKNAATARVCFMDTKKKLFANDGDAGEFCGCDFLIFLASLFLCDADALSLDSCWCRRLKKRAPAKSNKRKQPTPTTPHLPSPAQALLPSSKPQEEDQERHPKRKTKAKQSLTPETEETDEDRINAKAIAAGRARYVADKLAAEVKVKVEHPSHDEEEFDEENMGMNVDSGEDEGLTAVELIEKEVFGEGVEA
ncbi:unnamed protein product [Aureobasidium pullulans]|nr:unnamed protein product [Aureobasidium pullulans]